MKTKLIEDLGRTLTQWDLRHLILAQLNAA